MNLAIVCWLFPHKLQTIVKAAASGVQSAQCHGKVEQIGVANDVWELKEIVLISKINVKLTA